MIVLTMDEQSRRMVTCHDNKVPFFSIRLIRISNKRGADAIATVHEFHKMATINLCSSLKKGIQNEEAVHDSIGVVFF